MVDKSKYFGFMKAHPELFNGSSPLNIVQDEEEISRYENAHQIGVLSEDDYFIILRDLVRFPRKRQPYLRAINSRQLEGQNGAAVLPVYCGKIALVKIWRHGTQDFHLEIPRGFGEKGQTPEETAHKEVKEEISIEPSDMQPLGSMHTDTGMTDTCVYLFFAELPTEEAHPQSSEGIIDVKWLSFADFEKYVINGQITDSFSIAAYTLAKLQKKLTVD
jgi:ADP-ribose pyrophosphatase